MSGSEISAPAAPRDAELVWDDSRMDPSTPLVGFGVAFPASDNAKPVVYQVNKVFLQLEFGLSEDD